MSDRVISIAPLIFAVTTCSLSSKWCQQEFKKEQCRHTILPQNCLDMFENIRDLSLAARPLEELTRQLE